MRSFFQKKLWIVLLAVLALGSLTVLATSLDNVSFHEAQRFGQREASERAPISAQTVTNAWADVPLWKQLLVWGLTVLMIVLIGLLLTPELRKRLLYMFLRVSVMVVASLFILSNFAGEILALQGLAGEGGEMGNQDAVPMPVFQPPVIPPAISYLVSFAFALLFIGVMWGLYQGWKKYNALNTKKSLDEIAHIARSSLHDLNSGRDSSDVIINCYLHMSEVVSDKRKLQREMAMTPLEFAVRLERAGLPGDAVRRLTRLFEIVRYGDRKSAPKDVTEAVSCLNTILHYCGETV